MGLDTTYTLSTRLMISILINNDRSLSAHSKQTVKVVRKYTELRCYDSTNLTRIVYLLEQYLRT